MTPGFPAAMPHTYPTYEPFGGLKPVVAPVSPLSRTQTDGIGSPMLLVDPVWVSKLELESRLPRHCASTIGLHPRTTAASAIALAILLVLPGFSARDSRAFRARA